MDSLSAAALLLGLLALLLFLWARRLRTRAGLPFRARVVYADTRGWTKPERALYAPALGLAGRPDYILTIGRARVPVEVKPNRQAAEPREGDVFQLAAYGLLIEAEWGVPPAYGLLRYRDATWRIEFTPDLRAEVQALLGEMRRDLTAAEVARSHAEPGRCRACGYRSVCGQAVEQ